VACLCLLVCLTSCSASYVVRRSGPRLADIDGQAPVIKLHLADGSVYILSSWQIVGHSASIHGTGRWFGPDRLPAPHQPQVFDVPLSSVVIFETNSSRTHNSRLMWGLGTTYAVLVGAALVLVLTVLPRGDG
jgi:hypothetical protein